MSEKCINCHLENRTDMGLLCASCRLQQKEAEQINKLRFDQPKNLLACPFCGSKAKLFQTGRLFPNVVPTGWGVSCMNCNATGHWDKFREIAIAYWNLRKKE